MKIYVVNGAPGAGKTTFEQYIQKLVGKEYCKCISTIDFVKEIAYECGWDGTKTDKNRKFLSDLKDLLIRWNNVPYKRIEYQVRMLLLQPIKPWCLFIDCREPNEIDKMRLGLGAKTILVRRTEAEKKFPSNHADENVLNYYYDFEIDNNSDLTTLYAQAEQFLKLEGIPIKID